MDEAAALHGEAIEHCRASGRDEQLVISLFNLGRVSMFQGRYDTAVERFAEALDVACKLGYREMVAYCLKGTGEILAARGEPVPAAKLLGGSDRLFAELGAHVEAGERATYDYTVEELKRELGDEPFRAAHAEGQAAPFEQMLALALGAASPS